MEPDETKHRCRQCERNLWPYRGQEYCKPCGRIAVFKVSLDVVLEAHKNDNFALRDSMKDLLIDAFSNAVEEQK